MDDPKINSKSVAATPGQRKRAAGLVAQAKGEFGELLGGEEIVIRSAVCGGEANFPSPHASWDWNDLSNGVEPWAKWDSRGDVRGSLIHWMCTNIEAQKNISNVGIWIKGAKICGILDLQAAVVPFPLALCKCAVPDGIRLIDSQLPALHLDGACTSGLDADRIRVNGCVHLRNGFCAYGEVRFSGASIGGNLSCRNGIFGHRGEYGLELAGCRVNGTLLLDCKEFHSGRIDLGAAETKFLIDALPSWPGQVGLTQFSYGGIHPDSIGSLEDRLKWLAKHDATCAGDSRFDPQPYRQLAKVLRHSGHDSFANEVMYTASKKSAASQIRRHKDLGTLAEYILVGMLTMLNVAYILLVGRGYKRIRPFVWMVGLVFLGALVFTDWHSSEFFGDANPEPWMMQQTQGLALKNSDESWIDDYPAFRPIAYSADAFLPLVNLHQETYWTPRDSWVKSLYLPLHILMGWIVTTLAAVSITGLVRHEKE